MEDPGGAEAFAHGGWSFAFDRGDEGDRFKVEETMASDALLLGRRTYEGFAEAWPQRDGEFADKFNGMRKYVVSSTLRDPTWTNTTVIDGDVAAAVGELRDGPDGMIAVPRQRPARPGAARRGPRRRAAADDLPGRARQREAAVRRVGHEGALRLTESRTVGEGVTIAIYEPVLEGAGT